MFWLHTCAGERLQRFLSNKREGKKNAMTNSNHRENRNSCGNTPKYNCWSNSRNTHGQRRKGKQFQKCCKRKPVNFWDGNGTNELNKFWQSSRISINFTRAVLTGNRWKALLMTGPWHRKKSHSRSEIWFFFSDHGSRFSPSASDPTETVPTFPLSELKAAVSTLKFGRSADAHRIVAEMFVYLEDQLTQFLLGCGCCLIVWCRSRRTSHLQTSLVFDEVLALMMRWWFWKMFVANFGPGTLKCGLPALIYRKRSTV